MGRSELGGRVPRDTGVTHDAVVYHGVLAPHDGGLARSCSNLLPEPSHGPVGPPNIETVLRSTGGPRRRPNNGRLQEVNMARTTVDVVRQLLENVRNPDVMRSLVADDATYVSLNYEDVDLKKILPWTGTSTGPQAFIDTFGRVFQYWDIQRFEVKELFGAGENVAVFGTFTFKSKTLGKVATSPFSILAKVKGQKIVYFQFMEDTFATAGTFKVSGAWKVRSDPKGTEFEAA
jgi:uncharacterized protein